MLPVDMIRMRAKACHIKLNYPHAYFALSGAAALGGVHVNYSDVYIVMMQRQHRYDSASVLL